MTKKILEFQDTPSGKWTSTDLDIIHALVVDKESDVTVLGKQSEHLVVSWR